MIRQMKDQLIEIGELTLCDACFIFNLNTTNYKCSYRFLDALAGLKEFLGFLK